MTTAYAFWDRVADNYAKRPVRDEDSYQIKLRKTQEYLRPGMKVLELGCGTGTTALHHSPFVGEIDAVDISQKMIDIAREKAKAQSVDNVRFQRASLESFDAPPESYDVVMAHSLLHLLDDPWTGVARAHALLKPGGVFVASTACLDGKYFWLRLILPLGNLLRLLPEVRFMTEKNLLDKMTEVGFQIDHQWTPNDSGALFTVAIKS